jgi:2-polyprenyl-3-methyl-5-hydroxy-6-metoxy-1,4-benzoquinol methylase
MQRNKYYDWSRQRSLERKDGCKYEDWPDKSDDFPFAIHPKGFLVFLSPSDIEGFDEYSEGDPYTVRNNLHSEFHKRRFDSTIHLLKLAANDTSNPKILDVGCGEGHITAEIYRNFPGAEISGLDYSMSAISYAADSFPGIDFILANAYIPPYSENYFDVLVCNNLWEHVPDPLRLLKAIRKIIKPGGYIIISTPSRYRFENIVNVMKGKPVAFMSKSHVTEYSVGQVIEQLRFEKFEVEEIYSKPIKHDDMKTIKKILLYKIVMPLLRMYLRRVNLHHSIESTVFFLARKVNN